MSNLREQLIKHIGENGVNDVYTTFVKVLNELDIKLNTGISMNGLRKQIAKSYNQLIADINFFTENLSDMYQSDKQNLDEIKTAAQTLKQQIGLLNCCFSEIYANFNELEIKLTDINEV